MYLTLFIQTSCSRNDVYRILQRYALRQHAMSMSATTVTMNVSVTACRRTHNFISFAFNQQSGAKTSCKQSLNIQFPPHCKDTVSITKTNRVQLLTPAIPVCSENVRSGSFDNNAHSSCTRLCMFCGFSTVSCLAGGYIYYARCTSGLPVVTTQLLSFDLCHCVTVFDIPYVTIQS
jgi:hypothetical protein